MSNKESTANNSEINRKLVLDTKDDVKQLVGEMIKEPTKAVSASVLTKLLEILQSRAAISDAAIAEYHERKVAGDKFPPIDVVITVEKLELVCFNGYHRVMATERMGETHIDAKIIVGSREGAEILAAGANAAGVVPRSNEDKRSAARLLLSRPERASWSNNRLASLAKISPQVIEAVRVDMEKESGLAVRPEKRIGIRSGKPIEVRVTSKRVKAAVDPVDAIVNRVVKAAKEFDADARALLVDKLTEALGIK